MNSPKLATWDDMTKVKRRPRPKPQPKQAQPEQVLENYVAGAR